MRVCVWCAPEDAFSFPLWHLLNQRTAVTMMQRGGTVSESLEVRDNALSVVQWAAPHTPVVAHANHKSRNVKTTSFFADAGVSYKIVQTAKDHG